MHLYSKFKKRTETNVIVIHCSATKVGQFVNAETIHRWHTEDRGWTAIGYHYVITRDGVVESGRPYDTVGAGAKGHNNDSVHICLVGGINDDEEPENNFLVIQLDQLYKLIADLQTLYSGKLDVVGHRDLSGVKKSCPCFNVIEWFTSYKSNDDINNSNNENESNKESTMTDKENWFDKLKEYAPAVFTALANPMAGGAMAIKTLSKQLGVGGSEEEVKAAISRMDDSELKLKLKKVDLEFHKLALESEAKKHRADADVLIKIQDAALAEINSNDQYVRRTRPMIGRWSFFSGVLYCIGAEMLEFISPIVNISNLTSNDATAVALSDVAQKMLESSGADPFIAGAIFAPCMAYIGARSIDKVKAWNK